MRTRALVGACAAAILAAAGERAARGQGENGESALEVLSVESKDDGIHYSVKTKCPEGTRIILSVLYNGNEVGNLKDRKYAPKDQALAGVLAVAGADKGLLVPGDYVFQVAVSDAGQVANFPFTVGAKGDGAAIRDGVRAQLAELTDRVHGLYFLLRDFSEEHCKALPAGEMNWTVDQKKEFFLRWDLHLRRCWTPFQRAVERDALAMDPNVQTLYPSAHKPLVEAAKNVWLLRGAWAKEISEALEWPDAMRYAESWETWSVSGVSGRLDELLAGVNKELGREKNPLPLSTVDTLEKLEAEFRKETGR